MSNYLTKRILLTREAVKGTVPANPVCIEFLAESFDFKETQASEEISLLGSGGDASPMAFGSSSFSGSVGLVASTDNMPIILTHTLGGSLASVSSSTTDAWAATTLYAVNDTVNHSDGKHTLLCVYNGTSGANEPTLKSDAKDDRGVGVSDGTVKWIAIPIIKDWETSTSYAKGDRVNSTDGLHTLVCYIAGTSDTEPTLEANPNDDRNKRYTDGSVTWIAMPLLKTDTFELKQQMPSFTVEYEIEDADANTFYKRFSGVYANALPVSMNGGTISMKMSGDYVGSNVTDSTENGFESLATIVAGGSGKIVSNFKDYYTYEDCTVSIDDGALCEVESINLDTSRNVTVDNAINGCKIVNTGIANVKGSMNAVFELENYNIFKDHTDFKTTFDFIKPNGCGLLLTYSNVRPSLADPVISPDKQAYLNTELSAFGTSTTKSVLATVTYPSLVDSTGAIVGAY